jgi:predicted nucleic acid-binding protein
MEMKPKPVLYLEPSFWRRLLDREDAQRRRATYSFLLKIARKCRIRISRMVMAELTAVRDLELRRGLLRKLWHERVRSITAGAEVDREVLGLLREKILGRGRLADLYHIGYAMVGRCDYLVSWDEDDLARPWTQGRVEEYCRRNGLKRLRIGTPVEVGERWFAVKIR